MSHPVVEVLLAIIGVMRHRIDQMITVVYEVFFLVRGRLRGTQRGTLVRNDEQGSTAHPRMEIAG